MTDLISIHGCLAILAHRTVGVPGDDSIRFTSSSFRSYVSRSMLPQPVTTISGTRFWSRAEIQDAAVRMRKERRAAEPDEVAAPGPLRLKSPNRVPNIEALSDPQAAEAVIAQADADIAALEGQISTQQTQQTHVENLMLTIQQQQEAESFIQRLLSDRRLRSLEGNQQNYLNGERSAAIALGVAMQDKSSAQAWIEETSCWVRWRDHVMQHQAESASYQQAREDLGEVIARHQNHLVSASQWAQEDPRRLAPAWLPEGVEPTEESVSDYLSRHPHGIDQRHLGGGDFAYSWKGDALLRRGIEWRLSWIEGLGDLYFVELSRGSGPGHVLPVGRTPRGTHFSAIINWLEPFERLCREQNSIGLILEEVALQQRCGWPSLRNEHD